MSKLFDMNVETLFVLLLGHCIGDYLTQNAWMAFNKKKPGWEGFSACFIQCLVYTIFVYFMLNLSGTIGLNSLIFFLIFLSHYVIDRYNLIEWWLKHLRARSWDTHINLNKEVLNTKESMFLSFGVIVYVVADNTIHLLLMYLILKFILI